MTSPQVFDESDRYKVRISKTSDDVICSLLRQILTWVTPDWDQKTEFLTYLKNKGVNTDKLYKSLYPDQRKALQEDPTGVSKWDVSLTFLLLRYCGGALADKDDTAAWSPESGKEPECLITSLKNIRNAIAHETVKINRKDFFEKIEEIRKLMEKAISSVGIICSHISQTDIDTNIIKFNERINLIRENDIETKTFDEYKKELLFSEQMALIKEKGVPFLKRILDQNTTMTPLSLIIKGDERQVQVNEIFTGIQLEEDGKNREVLLEDLIEVASGTDAGRYILLKGPAGMGKTTLVKKMTSDWVRQIKSIKGLCSYDLLIYAEFRDRCRNFRRLLEISLGKEVHQSFRGGDLVRAVLGLRTLLIFDGYDELNSSSSELFQEILSLNKNFSQLTLIVTTRPEAEEKLKVQLDSTTLNAVHLRLVGIKANKREEFVMKYFLSLTKDSAVLQELGGLLEYLKKTGHKMSIVWEVAYNLCLLTILWMFKPDAVNRITTEAELYWQIHLLSISKLEERLQKSQLTGHVPSSVLENKIKHFLQELSWESLKGLKEDYLNLPQLTYQRITNLSLNLGIPVEELTGAFLKKVTTLNDSYYTFPHKGFMEFMGAYYIYDQVTKSAVDQLPIQDWKSCPTDILKRLHGGSLPDSLEKYQNLLLQTLSIFHVGDVEVPEETKIEVLELLEKSGLEDKDSFLRVMHNIKCNDRLARWIAQRHNLFDEHTEIDDSSFEAYITLLAVMDPPLPNKDKISIDIALDETPSGFSLLSRHLCRHQLKVRDMIFHDHYKGVSSPNTEDTESIKNLLSKDYDIYRGIWSPEFQEMMIPPSIVVRLQDQPSFDTFLESLEKTKEIRYLGICFRVNDIRCQRHIPFLEGNPYVNVSVTDVKEEDIEKVGDILRTLQPRDATKSIRTLLFPRCSLRSQEKFLRLLDSLKGVRLRDAIIFPEDKRPNDEASKEEMRLKAEESTGCEYGIVWERKEDMFW